MASHIQNALIQSPYSSPDIQYKVSYTATRIDNSNVRYDFTIQSLLQGYSQTSFRTGKILNCSITVGGISNSVTLKDRSEVWSGGSGGTTGEGTVHSTEYISITCPSSSGGEWQTVTFNVTRGDSGGNSGKVSTSDYYVISPDLLWTAAGGASVDSIIDNGDNTITVTCTMGADGYNNAVYNVHIYGFVDRSDGIPSYGDYDFSASDGSISGRTVTFTIPAPSSKSSYMVRICAYSISQKGDNPRGYPVNSGTINRYSVFTIAYDANGGTGAPASHSLAENEWGKLSTQIPTRKGYKFIGWQDHNDYTYDGVTYPWYAFDAPFYANTYGDVFAAYDYDKYNLIQHWVSCYVYWNSNGGHNYSSQLFHLQYYYDTNYSEFSPYYGTDRLKYVNHWIVAGYNEGRSGISNVINDNNDVYPAGANVRRLGTEGQTVVLTAKWEPLPYSVNINNTWVPCTIKVNVVGEGYIYIGSTEDYQGPEDLDHDVWDRYNISVQDNEDLFYITRDEERWSSLADSMSMIHWFVPDYYIYMKSNNVKQWVDCTI